MDPAVTNKEKQPLPQILFAKSNWHSLDILVCSIQCDMVILFRLAGLVLRSRSARLRLKEVCTEYWHALCD